MKSDAKFQEYRTFIEEYLGGYYSKFESEPQTLIFDAVKYSLLAGGKRLRPLFAFEFCNLCGGYWKDAAPFAAAIEMIHTYSLIHDDLPCMDNDDYRRGRLTSHKVFGEGIAVLAGDALLTDAFAIASAAKLEKPENMAAAIRILSENAGSAGMVGGQVLDILSENRVCTEQEVLDIQSRKTGALIKAACALGAIAGNATAAQVEAAQEFAVNLGLAFQIRDDVLDVIGSSDELGKSVGHDAGKNTFVRLYGLDECEKLVQEYTDKAINCLAVFNNADDLIELANSLTKRRI